MKYLNILFVILVSLLTVLLIADSVNAIGDFKEYKIGQRLSQSSSLAFYLSKNIILILFLILLIGLATANYLGKLSNLSRYLYYVVVVSIIFYTIYSYWQWYKSGYDVPY